MIEKTVCGCVFIIEEKIRKEENGQCAADRFQNQ